MAQERVALQEDDSVWKSRLVKFGVIVAVGAALLKWWNVAAVGVLIAGIGWAAWKGKK